MNPPARALHISLSHLRTNTVPLILRACKKLRDTDLTCIVRRRVHAAPARRFQQGSFLNEHDIGPRIGVVLGVCSVTVSSSPRFPGPSR